MKIIQKILNLTIVLALLLTGLLPTTVMAQTRPTSQEIFIHKIMLETLPAQPMGGGTDDYDATTIGDLDAYFGSDKKPKALDGSVFICWPVTEAQLNTMNATPGAYDTREKVNAFLGLPAGMGSETLPTAGAQGTSVQFPIPTTGKQGYWFIERTRSTTGEGLLLGDNMAVPFGITAPMQKSDGSYFGTGAAEGIHVYPKIKVLGKARADKNFQGQANTQMANFKGTAFYYSVGEKVPFEIATAIPAGAALQTARWSDNMTEGLSFNNDIVLKIAGTTLEKETDYTVTLNGNEGRVVGYELELTPTGLEKVNNKAQETNLTLLYSATINGNIVPDKKECNDFRFNYGNGINHGNAPIPTKPIAGKITITKPQQTYNLPPDTPITYRLINSQTGEVAETKAINIGNIGAGGTTVLFEGLDDSVEYLIEESPIVGCSARHTLNSLGNFTIENHQDDNPPALFNTEKPSVVTGGIKFIVLDYGSFNLRKPLAHAQFILKGYKGYPNSVITYLGLKEEVQDANDLNAYKVAEKNYQDKVKAANTLTPYVQELADLKAIRDTAYNKLKKEYVWVSNADDALKISSDTEGNFELTGLRYSGYTEEAEPQMFQLVETKAPVGYSKIRGGVMGVHAESGVYYSQYRSPLYHNELKIPDTGGIGAAVVIFIGISLAVLAQYTKMRDKKKVQK